MISHEGVLKAIGKKEIDFTRNGALSESVVLYDGDKSPKCPLSLILLSNAQIMTETSSNLKSITNARNRMIINLSHSSAPFLP